MTRPIHNLTLPAILFAVLGASGALNAETPVAPGLDRPLALSETAADLQWGDCPAIFPPGCKISVLHGNPAEPGADVFLRVPRAIRFRRIRTRRPNAWCSSPASST